MRAALYGAWEAQRRRVPLRLVCAYQTVPVWGPTVTVTDDVWQRGWLRDVFGRAEGEVHQRYPDLSVQTKSMAGSSAGVLVAESAGASLVVVATRALKGLRGRLAGSTSAQVAAHAFGPVVVLRPETDFGPDPSAFVGLPVVVGMDGSAGSQHALEFAVEEALARQAEVVAVFVWDLFGVHGIEPMVEPDYALSDAAAKADRLVSEAVSGWSDRYPDLKISSIAVHSLDPVAALTDVGARAGLIVVGSRGHGGFLGLRLGSTGDGLIRSAYVPVAVVRS